MLRPTSFRRPGKGILLIAVAILILIGAGAAVGPVLAGKVSFSIGTAVSPAVPSPAWVPFTPGADQTTVTADNNVAGGVRLEVAVTFPNGGYRVDSWGPAFVVGGNYRVESVMSRWTGMATMGLSMVSHRWDVAAVSPGIHNFSFYVNERLVKSATVVIPSPAPAALVHDVALTRLDVRGTPRAGSLVEVWVSTENQGQVAENFNVDLRVNGIPVGTQTEHLAPSAKDRLVFTWLVPGPGTYEVRASIPESDVPRDRDTGDRVVSGTFTVAGRPQTGSLEGVVTIGPIWPVEVPGGRPVPPEVYRARKVLVYDASRTRLIATVDLGTDGHYRVELAPGWYVVDINHIGMDRSPDVPASVQIKPGVTSVLNINIDTGIR